MEIYTFLAGIIAIISVLYLFLNSKNDSKLPPSPRGLPLLGNIFSLMKEPAKNLMLLSKIYGPIMTIKIGRKPCIVVCNYTEMKDLLKKKETTGRPIQGVFSKMNKGFGVLLSSGEVWAHHRKLVLQYFRESGKDHIENTISKELENTVDYLEKFCQSGDLLEMTELLVKSTCNVTSSLCFGKLYSYDDSRLLGIIEGLEVNFRLLFKVQSLAVFKPLITPFLRSSEQTILNNSRKFRELTQTIIDEHIEQYQHQKQTDSDFIYNYLSIADKEKDEVGDNKLYTKQKLAEITVDLFVAGTESTATSIRWLIILLISNEEAMHRMQMEIDEFVKRSHLPTWQERSELPYTVACLQESERMASIAHMSITHTCLSDFSYKDYVIPKGIDILYNIWGIHYDPDLWDEPHKFKPERFINEDGQVFRPDYLIPFGIGRRMCPGEMQARVTLFLYATTLFHKFNFHKISGEPDADSPPDAGLTRKPQRYKVKLSFRT